MVALLQDQRSALYMVVKMQLDAAQFKSASELQESLKRSTPFNDRLPFAFRLTQCVAVRIVELSIGQVIPFIAQIQLSFIQ